MPVYEEMIKDKDGKLIPKKIDGKKVYYVRTYVTNENGNAKQITRHNKNWVGLAGQNEAQQEENRLKNGELFSKKARPFQTSCEEYIKDSLIVNKEASCYCYENIIKNNILPFFGNFSDAKKFKTHNIAEWHKWLSNKKLKISYLQKCHTVLSEILNNEIKRGYLDVNVAKNIGNFEEIAVNKEKITKDEEKLRYITYEDFQKFISQIGEPIWYTYFSLLYFTGMRKGETQALTWNDVDFENKLIIVNKTLTTKTKEATWKITSTKNLKNRTIDIDSNLNTILYEYFKTKKQQNNFSINNFVFGDENNQPIKEHRIDDNKNKYFKKAGITPITNHEFRHSHVSLLVNEYLKLGQTDTTKFFIIMSRRLGHSIKTMQETYLHFFPDLQTPIISLLDNLNAKQDQKQDQEI